MSAGIYLLLLERPLCLFSPGARRHLWIWILVTNTPLALELYRPSELYKTDHRVIEKCWGEGVEGGGGRGWEGGEHQSQLLRNVSKGEAMALGLSSRRVLPEPLIHCWKGCSGGSGVVNWTGTGVNHLTTRTSGTGADTLVLTTSPPEPVGMVMVIKCF